MLRLKIYPDSISPPLDWRVELQRLGSESFARAVSLLPESERARLYERLQNTPKRLDEPLLSAIRKVIAEPE